jgi:Transposase
VRSRGRRIAAALLRRFAIGEAEARIGLRRVRRLASSVLASLRLQGPGLAKVYADRASRARRHLATSGEATVTRLREAVGPIQRQRPSLETQPIDLHRQAPRLNAAGTRHRRNARKGGRAAPPLEILHRLDDRRAVALTQNNLALAPSHIGSPVELVGWSSSLDPNRLWAVEDCRQLTGPLERRLLAAGESLVRVPPKLMAPERRAGRARGKSDPIDALAVARAALREPRLDRPRPGEAALRELKLLVDHRDDLVDERRRAQQRWRWQLHDLDPELAVPPGALDRSTGLR